MRLELYIRNQFMVSVDLRPFSKDKFLSFRANYEVRKEYVKQMTEELKLKYHRAIENGEWEIYLVEESEYLEEELQEMDRIELQV